MDIRKQRSKTFIWQAFFELMTNGQSFSPITVNQICEKALVHRSTFYKHFEDKYDLLDFGLAILFADYHALSETKKATEPFTLATQFFENSAAQLLLEAQKNDEVFSDLLKNYAITMMKTDVLTALNKTHTGTIPLDLLAEFHISSVFTLSNWQIKNKLDISAEQMDDYFKQLVLKPLADSP